MTLMSPLVAGRINCLEVVIFPKIFPPLQRDRHIAITPQEVVKRSQAELVALSKFRIGEKMQDLTLPNLIADGLPGGGREQRRLSLRRFLVHGHMLSTVVVPLRNGAPSECKLSISFNA